MEERGTGNRGGVKIVVAKDVDELGMAAAQEFAAVATASIKARGRFAVALSGGSTPRALYRSLRGLSLPWAEMHFFFGDERNVSPVHDESNYRLAHDEFFVPMGIEERSVYRWLTELGDPDAVAADYEKRLRAFFSISAADGLPEFDLILLGMGGDGHTASLFPGTEALDAAGRLAVPNPVPQLQTLRFTLTFPAINAARNIVFMVSGADKSRALKEVLEGDRNPNLYPAQAVRPLNGALAWFVDNAAAGLLAPETFDFEPH